MGILASLGTWLLGKVVSWKGLLIIAVLVLLGYGQYRFYDWSHARGYQAGVTSQADTISSLKSQLASALSDAAANKASLNGWISKYNAYVTQSTQQVQDLQNKYNATQATYTKELSALQAALAQKEKELADATSTYVTPTGDAACVVPLGFVQLYNLSLEGLDTPASGAARTASLTAPYAPSTTADLPSGLSLSTVAGVLVNNNSAALTNRQLVLGWQAWWAQVQKDYETYQSSHPTAPTPSAKLLVPPPQESTSHEQRQDSPSVENRRLRSPPVAAGR